MSLLRTQEEIDELLKPQPLMQLASNQPLTAGKTTIEQQDPNTGIKIAQVIETTDNPNPQPTSGRVGNAWTMLEDWKTNQADILKHLNEQLAPIRQRDSILGTSEADRIQTKIIQQLKLQGTQVEEAAEREMNRALFTGTQLGKDRPILSQAARDGATVSQLGTINSIVQDTYGRDGETMRQALFIAEQYYNNMLPEEIQQYTDQGVGKQEIINQKAAELISEWKMKPASQVILNEAVTDNAFQKEMGKGLAAKPIAVYTDPDKIYANAGADVQRMDYAINLLETGAVETGPLTTPWLTVMRFINQAFAGGSDEQRKTMMDRKRRASKLTDMNMRDAEYLDSLFTLLGARNIQLTKGNVTEREMLMFLRIAPELSKTTDGNIMLLKVLRNMNLKLLDYHSAAYQYLEQHGDPKSGTHWAAYMRNNPLVQKWAPNKEGIGGVIPQEYWDAAMATEEPRAGIPANYGGYNITSGKIGEAGEWGPKTDAPFSVQQEDGTVNWYIVGEDGYLWEVELK